MYGIQNMMPTKKRDFIAIALVLLVSILSVRCYVFQVQERSWSAGTLVLPGNENFTHNFAMPLSGAFRILFQPIIDGSVERVPGTVFDSSTCRLIGPKPTIDVEEYQKDPANYSGTIALADYYNMPKKCVRFGRFGIVRFELRDAEERTLIHTRYSLITHQIPNKLGTMVAAFRSFKKGRELVLTVTSFLSSSLEERERIPYKVILEPFRLSCVKPNSSAVLPAYC